MATFTATVRIQVDQFTTAGGAGFNARVAACPRETGLLSTYGLTVSSDTTASAGYAANAGAIRTIVLNVPVAAQAILGTNCTDIANALGNYMRASLTQCMSSPAYMHSVAAAGGCT